jgi:hypothetical protein
VFHISSFLKSINMNDLNSDEGDGETENNKCQPHPEAISAADLQRDPVATVEINQQERAAIEAESAAREAKATQKETLDAVRKGERIALIIAGVVAFATIGQWITSCNNNASTSIQTDKLICAANKNAAAAEKFRIAAEGINAGIGDAVRKLNLQAGELAKNATQTSRLAGAAIQGNQLSKDAIEAQLGANRPILEIENLGGPQRNEIGGRGQITGVILYGKETTFQFRLKNTGPGEAQNVRYAISQPRSARGDHPLWMIRQSIEISMDQGDQLGSIPITGKVPNIFGHAESDAILVEAGNRIPSGSIAYDFGEYFYGEVDWDDIIGFGHRWRRKFCLLVLFGKNGESIADCGVKQEGLYARDDSQKKFTKRTRRTNDSLKAR